MVKAEKFVVVGRVRRAFGTKGELSVDWYDGSCPVSPPHMIYLESGDDGALKGFLVENDRPHGDHSILRLKDVDTRDAADNFRGSDIWVRKEDLRKLSKGEYYTYQITRMKVLTDRGCYLGDIVRIFSTGSNDVYVVRKGKKEVLIPAIKDVVKEIDLEKKVMIVELIEGLV